MIGWDEINDRNAADISDVIMIWQRDGREQQQKALKRGLSVIMSPKDPCYFDFGYSRIPHADCMNGNQLAKNVRILKHISSREDRLICGLNSLQPRMRWKGCYIPELVPWPKPSGTRKKRKNGKGSDNVSASSVLLWKN